MSEKSRDEKLAAAKKKLKKFQDNNTKEKKKTNKPSYCSISNNQVLDLSNSSDFIHTESITHKNDTDLNVSIDLKDVDVSTIDIEEPTITTESLKHISRHLNGIISCSNSSIDRETQMEYATTIRDLERRNIELATLHSQKVDQIESLNVKIANLNETLSRLNKEHVNELLNLEHSYKKQVEQNKDQFQAQIHTISLLVAEKSELQSQVTHNQKVAAHRHQENEDITNKLKGSRQKVGDLEKVLIEMKTKNDKLEEAFRDMSRQSEQMRSNIKKLKSEKDDTVTECLQLRSKLMSKTQEISNLELTLDDVKSQLEMSQVQNQHLSNSHEGNYDNMYEQLKLTEQKNFELMQNLEVAKMQLQQVDSQNSRIENQYRTYFEQMEEKIKTLQSELFYTLDEKNELFVKCESLKKSISETREDKNYDFSFQNSITNLQQEKDWLTEKVKSFETIVTELNASNTSLSNNNEKLANVVKELEDKNIDLIEKNNQFQINKVDHIDLLQQLQSDKTALSRSLAQNKQLKSQLIELQEAFVKVSSDNMDLTTKLDHEMYVSKELSLRLGEQEDELNEIRIIVGNKDEEIARLLQSNKQITEELLTTNNSSENSYQQRSESHFGVANTEFIMMLQTDVSQLQDKINQLMAENNALRYQNKHSDDEKLTNENTDISNEYNNSFNISLLQLEAERDELLVKCDACNAKELELIRQLENYKEATDENNLIITKEKYDMLQLAMAETNKKFHEVLEKNIQIVEDNKRLEHIVARLEDETDTIGEYINLYQHQRSVLKQKSLAKDQFMSKLMHQKQLFDSRLSTLEFLIGNFNLRDTNVSCIHNDGALNHGDQDSNHKVDNYNQIIDIIHELKMPTDLMLQINYKSSDENEMKTNVNDSFISDNLFHSEFIHCKCCVGKIIDL